jgi:hypothetical protein
MNCRTRIITTFLALAAVAAWLPAESQQSQSTYNVEIIVFRARTAQGGAENWSAEAASAGVSVGAEGATAGTQVGRLVQRLPATSFQLNAVESKLKSSGLYVPVAHLAWTQTASAWGKRSGLSIEQLGVDVAGLSGSVSLERGQYLHLGFALSYAPASPPANAGAAPGTVFTLNENRRVKFYERNYYDHPAFGVIALVTPSTSGRP